MQVNTGHTNFWVCCEQRTIDQVYHNSSNSSSFVKAKVFKQGVLSVFLLCVWFWQQPLAHGRITLLCGYLLLVSISVYAHLHACLTLFLIKKTII